MLVATLTLGACAVEPFGEGGQIKLPDDALAPALAPELPVVGTEHVWCRGSSVDNCNQVTQTVTAVDGNCVWFQEGNEKWSRCLGDSPYFLATTWEGGKYGTGHRTWKSKSGTPWPLQIGTQYAFEEHWFDESGDDTRDGMMTVVGVEQVKIPAGTFDVYRLKITLGDHRHHDVLYSPELGEEVFYHRRSTKQGDDDPKFLVAVNTPAS